MPPVKAKGKLRKARGSIPSKFETVLNVGRGEANAFGTRTFRFADATPLGPGPGSYRGHNSLGKEGASLSKRGFGNGFVSRTARFGDRVEMESAFAPGPGAYTAADDAAGRRRAAAARPSAAFAAPLVTQPLANRAVVPGPGSYDPDARARRRRRLRARNSAGRPITHSAVFRSSLPQRATRPADNAPPVGRYDPGAETARASTARAPASHAAFRSGTRKGTAIAPARDAADRPGPGAYAWSVDGNTGPIRNAVHPSVLNRPLDAQLTEGGYRVSSMFAQSGHDRWGRPLVPRVAAVERPGPGAYGAPPRASDSAAHKPGATAAFASRTRRDALGARARDVPGPAQYAPDKGGKQSFHLNATQRWVS